MNTAVVTVHGNLAACSFANTSGPVNLADRQENVSCVHFQHTQQSDAFSVPLSNGSVTHANCNEYQSRRNEDVSRFPSKRKSKNISTNYVAALQVRTSESERRIIDIDHRHVDLNSTE